MFIPENKRSSLGSLNIRPEVVRDALVRRDGILASMTTLISRDLAPQNDTIANDPTTLNDANQPTKIALSVCGVTIGVMLLLLILYYVFRAKRNGHSLHGGIQMLSHNLASPASPGHARRASDQMRTCNRSKRSPQHHRSKSSSDSPTKTGKRSEERLLPPRYPPGLHRHHASLSSNDSLTSSTSNASIGNSTMSSKWRKEDEASQFIEIKLDDMPLDESGMPTPKPFGAYFIDTRKHSPSSPSSPASSSGASSTAYSPLASPSSITVSEARVDPPKDRYPPPPARSPLEKRYPSHSPSSSSMASLLPPGQTNPLAPSHSHTASAGSKSSVDLTKTTRALKIPQRPQHQKQTSSGSVQSVRDKEKRVILVEGPSDLALVPIQPELQKPERARTPLPGASRGDRPEVPPISSSSTSNTRKKPRTKRSFKERSSISFLSFTH